MAKDTSAKKAEVLESAEPMKDTAETHISTVSVSPPAEEVWLTFDRWFSTTGRPPHHKGGLKAFAITSGKKTVAAWNAIFATY